MPRFDANYPQSMEDSSSPCWDPDTSSTCPTIMYWIRYPWKIKGLKILEGKLIVPMWYLRKEVQWFEPAFEQQWKGFCSGNFKVKTATTATHHEVCQVSKVPITTLASLGVLSTMSLAGDSSWFSCILTLGRTGSIWTVELKCGKQLRPHVAVINQPEKYYDKGSSSKTREC